MIKKIYVLTGFVFLLLSVLFSCGCWNRRELNTLAIVAGTAIDKAEKNGQIELTAQIIRSSQIQTPVSGGGGSEKTYLNLSTTGTEVFDIIRSMGQSSPRKLYWSNNQVILLGEELAQEGLYQHLDFFIRDHESRILIPIAVAEKKAKDLLSIKPELCPVPASCIKSTIENQKSTSTAPLITMKDFAEHLLSNTTAPVLPLISKEKGKGEEEDKIVVSGTAVFKDGKMIGKLDKKETRGLLWITGNIKSGIILVDCPESKTGNKKVSLEIIRANSKVIPELKNEKIIINIIINVESNLGSHMCEENLTEEEYWIYLEKSLTESIHKEIMSSYKKAITLNADIFGFGEALHLKHPSYWKETKNKWDQLFPLVTIDITIKAKLRQAGLSLKPLISQ